MLYTSKYDVFYLNLAEQISFEKHQIETTGFYFK